MEMPPRFKGLGALLALVLAPVVVPAAEVRCDRSGSKSTPSPDGRWIANVQEEVCETPSGGAAAGITVVLVSAGDAARSKRVFIMPVPRSRDDWPRIRWPGPDAMEVRIPNLAEAGPPEPEFGGVRITLVHCGDNPADRARLAAYREAVKQWQQQVSAWVKKRDEDAAAAGPRPPRPVEPVLAPGRCVD
jgi:hypothetical protein